MSNSSKSNSTVETVLGVLVIVGTIATAVLSVIAGDKK